MLAAIVPSLPLSDESEEYTPDSSAFSSPLPEPIDENEYNVELVDDGSTTGAGAVFYFDVPHSVYLELEPGSDDSRYDDLEDDEDDEDDVHMSTHMYEYGDSYLVVVKSPAASPISAPQPAPAADLSSAEALPAAALPHDMFSTPRKRRFSESSADSTTSMDSGADDLSSASSTPAPIPSSPERKRSRLDDRLSVLLDSKRGTATTLRNVARLIGAANTTRDALLAVDLSALNQATLLTLHEMVESALREQPDDLQNRRRRSRKHTTRRKPSGSPSKRTASDSVVVVETAAVAVLSSALDEDDEDDEIDVVNM